MARHSIELSIKSAIVEFAGTDTVPAHLEGHGLLALWYQLGKYMARWGTPNDDNWGKHCEKLLSHMHEADPDGERYRYPADLKGQSFTVTLVDLEDLVMAHWHITTYCDGCVSMHAAGYRG